MPAALAKLNRVEYDTRWRRDIRHMFEAMLS